MGVAEYDVARVAAGKAKKAQRNAKEDRDAINLAANEIKPAQQQCPTYLTAAQDALLDLETNHPQETDAIAAVVNSIQRIELACFEQLEAFGPADELIAYTNSVFVEIRNVANEAVAARNGALADSDAITALYDAARPQSPFEQFVESFVIPTESGSCTVQATRSKNFETYDFFVYYLVGDCAG